MIALNEQQVRQIVMEEWSNLLDEAGERRIVRPGAPPSQPSPAPRPTQTIAPPPRPSISSLADIVATTRSLRPGSAFVAGSPAFNAIYNGGNDEELIRFKIKNKQNPDDDRMLSRLVSHVFNAGSFVIVPELFEKGEVGVGEIIDIVNRPVPDAPGETAPLALVDFGGRRVINVGIAFLVKISRNKVDEYNMEFKAKQRRVASRPSVGGMKTVKYRPPG